MKPQTEAFLDKARECLAKADGMLASWPDEAGRAAYLAGLHAAQAFLFETTGRTFKRHSSVQGEFGRQVKEDARFDVELRAFLGRTYDLKAIADYETGAGSKVSAKVAREAVETAKRLVAAVAAALNASDTDRRSAEPT
jgi:uncharacterized protein (UPF0332 family)